MTLFRNLKQAASKVGIRHTMPYACLLLTLWVPIAAAEPQLMADSELDAVSARGHVDEEGEGALNIGDILGLADPEGQGALFRFDLGNVFGDLGLDLSGVGPSSVTLNGALSPSVLQVENLILNLNICAGCRADTIYQLGLGVPIKVDAPITAE